MELYTELGSKIQSVSPISATYKHELCVTIIGNDDIICKKFLYPRKVSSF